MRRGSYRLSARLSADGMYYWDGQRWVSTLSADGRHRWNGATWVAVAPVTYGPVYQPRPALREPTSWTRPLQIAIVARYVAAALYGLAAPLWLNGYMSQVVQQSLQRQRAAHPPGESPPPGFSEMMTSILTASLWFGVVLVLGLAVLVTIAAMRHWTWAYYAILIYTGFSLLSFVYTGVDLATGGALTRMQPVQPPLWTRLVGLASGALDIGLFTWMLIALIRRGPWAMRRIAS